MTCEVCCSHNYPIAITVKDLTSTSLKKKCHSEQLSEEPSSTSRPVL